MMSAKFVTLSLLKIKVFCNKSYDVIILVTNVTNKVLSHEDLIRKNYFLRGDLGSSPIIQDWH